MKKEELFRLLDEESLPDRILDQMDAPVWRFWEKGKHLDDSSALSVLREYILLRTEKKNTRLRENAYILLGKLLHRTADLAYCQFMIDCLAQETDKYVLRTMLTAIARLQLPASVEITPIAACSRSKAWQVRHSAIQALGASNSDASREALRYWVGQEDEKLYKDELIYASAALGYIGEPGDIALLERHIHSRIRDVKDSAFFAINNIRQCFGMNPLGQNEVPPGGK